MLSLGYTPFSDPPATAQWNFPITRSDYTKILRGYRPQMMEDKWSVKTKESAEGGNTIMRALWGWQNHERMRLIIAPGDPKTENSEAKDWAKIVSIEWKLLVNGEEVSEAKTKRSAVGMCNALCGCELEAEPGDSDTCIDDDNNEDEDNADDSDSDSGSPVIITPSVTRASLGLPYYVPRAQKPTITGETPSAPLPSTSCPSTKASPPADTN
ncbi:hypothetical protein P171DRAFT_470750 [Karstenula rhodostoma CBS 690.94]|uniref:Uncharacterized protein n=1 Tax=Karstenula rhodostoma CBS 690.94 TaxID=1392251 RepID=A0A9P4UD62_9PLEO|nr:hypothetical protein P171DRAFT_470750 [Karstenula rhodostoma CBS 690.94]